MDGGSGRAIFRVGAQKENSKKRAYTSRKEEGKKEEQEQSKEQLISGNVQ